MLVTRPFNAIHGVPLIELVFRNSIVTPVLRPILIQVGFDRLGEEIPLELITFLFFKKVHLLLGFDPFANNLQVQAMRHSDDGCNDGGIFRARRDFIDQRTVDLKLANGKPFQVGERRIPGSKIIDHQPHA